MTELLILTIILECLALLLLGERTPLFYLYWVAVTALTNVLANLYLIYVFSGGLTEYYINVAIIEILVFAAEFALCYLYISDKKKSRSERSGFSVLHSPVNLKNQIDFSYFSMVVDICRNVANIPIAICGIFVNNLPMLLRTSAHKGIYVDIDIFILFHNHISILH